VHATPPLARIDRRAVRAIINKYAPNASYVSVRWSSEYELDNRIERLSFHDALGNPYRPPPAEALRVILRENAHALDLFHTRLARGHPPERIVHDLYNDLLAGWRVTELLQRAGFRPEHDRVLIPPRGRPLPQGTW
jgi:hypothetical protein